jgi:hypothetical protein
MVGSRGAKTRGDRALERGERDIWDRWYPAFITTTRKRTLKKLMIAAVALTFMASASMAGSCVTPKYIAQGENDIGARVVSGLVLVPATILAAIVQAPRVFGDDEVNASADRALCFPKQAFKHVTRTK